ncbi:unnamed protein product [marine sediment metagenome]|uniref:Uncharacterized protein n=1 Tax=marine sediment metagenome TaxID=412755 RepID=X1UXE5_9ZZZZ
MLILHHPNCENPYCATCFADHEALERILQKRCGTGNEIDHLGKYSKWMTDNGYKAETEAGGGKL